MDDSYMQAIGLLAAIAVPWVLGTVWVRAGWERPPAGAWSMTLGYGFVIGMVTTTLVMRLWDVIGLSQDFWWQLAALSMLALVGLRYQPPVRLSVWGEGWLTRAWCSQPVPQRLAFIFLFSVLCVHFLYYGLEIVWRPLYPWDAWMNWAPKARVWFEMRSLVDFVGPAEWLDGASLAGAYTLGNPNAVEYPPTVPLLQLWIAMGLGVWDGSLINLPWLLCLIALTLAFFGQIRLWGASPMVAMVLTYLLVSVPYLGVHTALAGYAELWMAAVYGLAAMSFLHWARDGDPRQGIIALGLALACTQIKIPGIVWMLTFVPAVVIALLPGRWAAGALILALIAALALFWSGGLSIDLPFIGRLAFTADQIAIPGIGSYGIEYHDVWRAFATNDYLLANWHLLGYLFTVGFVLLVARLPWRPEHLPGAVLLLAALGFLFVVFFLTRHHNAALSFTTINRATLHAVPMISFVLSTLLMPKRMSTA